MQNETPHPAQSPATPAIPFFARYLERLRKVTTAATAGVEPKVPPFK